ncbi:methyl-accepting chemotaxis protein [Phenylobacterium sp. J426]|uniref:globin-coupled sensor protein n=1 Tax=Phenylobacterium sp. J426 TaxID=2898439 RepID=UPI002150FE48|nr:globin-coupled sensor protein [Phenylobacterium sp. J426]MCR5874689.1 methyl-accepting chemotaxis protein [Phenylobacterium sp. J426]
MSDKYAVRQRLEFIGLDNDARAALARLKPFLADAVGPALDGFYGKVRATPEVRQFFRDDAHIAVAQGAQSTHWTRIADATFDDAYVRGVRTIGETHARIGLEPRWYIGGYALILERLLQDLIETRWAKRGLLSGRKGGEDVGHEAGVLAKAVLMDMDFAISIYLEALEAKREQLEAERQDAERRQSELVAALADALARVSAGDLRARMEVAVAPEFDALKRDFNTAIATLEQAIGAASAASDEVTKGVGEIGLAADQLSRRTEQQAASLEQTAAALEEITVAVRRSAEGAQEATRFVAAAKADADASAEVVRQAVGAMDEIAGSSRRISEILGVIDEIAFQTNLLALNAGVEAARAGDAGKGFAVVASEVRALAQRSADAAKEIEALIGASTRQVQTGVQLVGKTGEALSAIVQRIGAIDTIVGESAASAQEQARGLGEVNIAVSQLDQITQQNAAMVEETSAATQSLSDQAAGLAERMGGFRVSGAQAATERRLRAVA